MNFKHKNTLTELIQQLNANVANVEFLSFSTGKRFLLIQLDQYTYFKIVSRKKLPCSFSKSLFYPTVKHGAGK